MEENKKPILVLGIGNLLFKDGGVGIHVVQKMMDMELPPTVEVIDGGKRSTGAIYISEKKKKAIVITSMKAGGPPGSIYRFAEQGFEEKRTGYERSIEEIEITADLMAAHMLGRNPEEVIFIGVEPEDIGDLGDMNLDSELTPVIEGKITEIIEAVMREIRN